LVSQEGAGGDKRKNQKKNQVFWARKIYLQIFGLLETPMKTPVKRKKQVKTG